MNGSSPASFPAPAPKPIPLDEFLRRRVLAPYRPQARYVLRAAMSRCGDGSTPRRHAPDSWLGIDGDCGFEQPCYIEATGHFNAVEANITFNQLLYLCMAAAVRAQLLPELQHWTLEDFFRAQLPDVLIADYHARFRSPIRSQRYSAHFRIVEVIAKPERSQLRLQTQAEFRDDHGGQCTVDASIAIVNWQPG